MAEKKIKKARELLIEKRRSCLKFGEMSPELNENDRIEISDLVQVQNQNRLGASRIDCRLKRI